MAEAPQSPQQDDGETQLPRFDRGNGGLLPAIAQDHETGVVLMLAWMNQEAFEETIRTGVATYFSRSRNQIWRKGETSGHRQRVVEIRVDCDEDAILMRVQQAGAACHEGYFSCFFRAYDDEKQLQVVEERLVDPDQVYHRG
ncbi:MAG: phosphoribosyl-AMP cyclohydrolase [Planctomycetota bacterium]